MKNNKYLKELGIKWTDLPGNYINKSSFRVRVKRRWYKIKIGFCAMFSKLEEYTPDFNEFYESNAFDIRNKEDKEGFCEHEFFNLDWSLATYIYPRLCKFKDDYSKYGAPSCVCFDEDGNHLEEDIYIQKWQDILDKMILSFRYILDEPEWETIEESRKIQDTIQEGLHLFAEYYQCLWW